MSGRGRWPLTSLAAGAGQNPTGTGTFLAIDGSARGLILLRGPVLEAAVAAGYDVHACAPLDSLTRDIHQVDIFSEFRDLGVSLHEIRMNRLGLNPMADLRTVFGLIKVIRELRPDVVLCYSMKSILYGTMAARACGVRNCYSSVTGLGYLFVDGERRTPFLKRILRSPIGVALKSNRKVFFQNPDDLDLFLGLGFLRDREQAVIVNGSGVDLDRFHEAPFPDTPLHFLMIGRLHRHKGVLEFAEAARILKSRYPELRFSFVGPHDDHPSALSAETLERLEADGAVELLGGQPDVGPSIRESHVFVLPSYREGTSRSMLEAMASGRPVVATDVPGCREPVEEGVNGFLVPDRNPRALADAMERFVRDPELIPAMGKQSRRIAEERYDVRDVVRLMTETMGITPASDVPRAPSPEAS